MFEKLIDLTSIASTKKMQEIAESKSASSDFDGILSVVNDSLADLDDKVEALTKLAKKTGALKLDTVKDKEGLMVFEKISKATKEYKASMEKLMLEAEIMVKQVAEDIE